MIAVPLVVAALGLSMQLQSTTRQPDASVAGRVTADDSTSGRAPVAFVVVEVTDSGGVRRQVLADSSGLYTIAGLSNGEYTLRFEHAGYVPLSLDVRVPEHGALHLDVTLDRAPPMMQTIKIVARDGLPRIPARPDRLNAYRPWRTDGDQMGREPALDFPDVVRTVGTSTFARVAPESGGGIHMQGGATDHTQLLLDGIPLYNAVHAGDHTSAVDPDAVAAMSVYGEPRAEDGGRLSGVVDISTRSTLPDSQHVRTAIWPTGMRMLSSLSLLGGSALVGARSNYARPQQGNTNEPLTLDPTDLFGTATVPLTGGSLTGMIFSARDAIAFDAGAPPVSTAAPTETNRLRWSSGAGGLTWRRDSDIHSFDLRLWQSGTAVNADWISSPSDAMRLTNRFVQTGASTSFAWLGKQTHATVGASLERMRGEYVVSSSSGTLPISPLLTTRSGFLVASAYLEHSRQLVDHLLATVGERLVWAGKSEPMFEPRVAIAYQATNGVSVSAAFAHTHQYVQSLYNDESLVDAMASLEVPVLAGADGMPTALSNSVSAQVDVPVGPGLLITIAGFGRSFERLALAGPSGGGPFPTQTVAFGSGEAYGGTLRLRDHAGPFSLEGAYSIDGVSRESRHGSYRPSFAPSQNLFVAAGYQLGKKTILRASGSLTALRSTSPMTGPVAWDWQDAVTTQRLVSGSPQYSAATLGTGRLDPYLRIDLGARQTVSFSPLRLKATVFANIDNLLDRRNSLGIVQGGGTTWKLGMLPRSLSLGASVGF